MTTPFMPPPPPPPPSVPSLSRQKSFIIENNDNLSEKNEKDILNIVNIHSPELIKRKEVIKGSTIDLNKCRPETITAIYHIVKARREFLNKPMGQTEFSS